jgi:hypothetical protein
VRWIVRERIGDKENEKDRGRGRGRENDEIKGRK